MFLSMFLDFKKSEKTRLYRYYQRINQHRVTSSSTHKSYNETVDKIVFMSSVTGQK